MDRELKRRWIEALRSGKYKQGIGALKIKNGESENFCCLGVLCDISGLGEWEPEKVFPNYIGKDFIWFSRECHITNPDAFNVPHGYVLTAMNDGYLRTHTFEEIADYIEKYIAEE